MEVPELALHRRAQLHVEVGERLVEQHERRLRHEAARERHALPLAARERCRPPLAEAVEMDQRQRVAHARAPLGILDSRHGQAVGDVFRDRHVRPERIGLENDADPPLLRRNLSLRRGDHRVADQDSTGIRTVESGDQPQQRGLAAARRAQDRDELAVGNLQRDVRERGEVAVLLAEALEGQSRHGSIPLGNCSATSSVDSINAMLTKAVNMPRAAA